MATLFNTELESLFRIWKMIDEKFVSSLSELIESIDELHQRVTSDWRCYCKEKNLKMFNMKTNKMIDVLNNESIQTLIYQYDQFLNQNKVFSMFENGTDDFEICCRVKTVNSIEYKINRYQGEKHGNGYSDVNHCLNDLFGIRVIADTTMDHSSILDYVATKYSHLKCRDSSKPPESDNPHIKYTATHIYFKGNPKSNLCFPWELQIWIKTDKEMNNLSHALYKQDYTSWEMDEVGEK